MSYNETYLGQSVAVGLLWPVMGNIAFWIKYFLVKDEYVTQVTVEGYYDTILGVSTYVEPETEVVLNKWAGFAWDSWQIGSAGMWGFLTLFWIFSYIKGSGELYRLAVLWTNIVSWIYHVWIICAHIVAGLEEGATLWKHIVYACS